MRERKIKAELLKSDFLTKLFLQNEVFFCVISFLLDVSSHPTALILILASNF